MRTFKNLLLPFILLLTLGFAAVAKSPPINPSESTKFALQKAPAVSTFQIETPFKINLNSYSDFGLVNSENTSIETLSLMDYKPAKTFKIFQKPPEIVKLE